MSTPAFAFSSESNERYTPPEIIDAARSVMGSIELDAASCDLANLVVRADRYYTAADDALKLDWVARSVWCNPPYGKVHNQSRAGLFLSKMVAEYTAGHFEEGILLVNAAPSAAWFLPAYRYPVCFTNGRLNFLDHNLVPLTQPTKDNALIYFGDNVDRFIARFNGMVGTVVFSEDWLVRWRERNGRG